MTAGPMGVRCHRMAVVEQLADWVASLAYDDIPERVLERARYQVVNVMASLYAGATSSDAQKVVAAVRGWSAPGPCTLIPFGDRLGLFDAVYAASALGMALDYDDYLYMGHTGHSSVLASFALCEAERLPPRDLLVAQVIANELGGRVGASVVLGPQNGQAWSFIHAVGAAGAASRLYQLDRQQTAHALSIALYQPTFTLWPGFMGPGSKVLTAAGPTVAGIQAARLAREGLTGARRIFEHPRKGFWASFSYAPLPGMMTGLGRTWVTDTLAYKKYPGCAYIDTTMDALFMALREFEHTHGRGLRPEEVRSIEVEASLLSVEMDNLSAEHVGEGEPLSPVNINFSIPFNVAIGVLAGRHTPVELEQDYLDEHGARIRELASKVHLAHDWSMSLSVAEAFAGALGRSSPLRSLSPRDLVRIATGYQSQMGGGRKHALGASELLSHLPALARRARALMKVGGSPERGLDAADLSRFRMVFPARVTIETTSHERTRARQDVPFGAPGQSHYLETVHDKFRQEAARWLGRQDAERALAALVELESADLDELSRLLSGRPADAS